MIKVTELTYSKKDFKDILRSVTPIQDDAQKMDLDPFPSTADLAVFANKAYSGKDELPNGLPEGWELLTAVCGRKGYFGCLYFNPSRQQVVLTHRGTVPNIPGTLYADLKSVVLNKYTDYMFSAVTLGDDIKRAILNLNKQTGVRFTLTITGHSLGGWISQVTAITLKHLKRQGNEFVRVSNIDEGIHAHTVVFDSPGVQDMAIKIQRDYGRYNSTPYSMFRSLDISTFFMAVNLVNATGFHIGPMYHISSNLVCTPGYKHLLSNVSTHSMENFTKAFEVGNVKLFQVKDWPQGWGERTPVHEQEKAQGTLHPKPEGGPSVRYNIGEEDPGMTVGLHRFSEVELDFVNLIRMVRLNKIRESNIETFFGAKSFQDLFPNFAINRKEKTVTLDSELSSKNFVKNIKNALRWFSGGLQDAMEEQKKLTLPSFLLDMFSQECVDSILDLPDCEDPLGLCEFTDNKNTARILYVQAADCSLEMARIYNILCNSYPDIDQCIFLNWESLLKLNKYLTTEGLPLNNNNCNLFVINIGSTTEVNEDILKYVISKFKVHSEKKAVIISHEKADLFNFVNSFELELAICCLPLSAQECLEFTFNDLKDTSRRELLFSKEFINLGKQAMSLNALLGENCQSSDSIDNVLKPFLKDLLTDESFTLNISNNLLKFDQLDVMFSKINREVKLASLTKLLLEETCSLFVSSDVRQLLEPQLQEVPGAAERVLYISGSREEDFRQACLENSSIHVAYWLAATDSRLFLKEVYNRSFYLSRKFYDQSIVDLEKIVQKINYVDLFIFVGVTDKVTLLRYLNTPPEVEELFSTNLQFKCFQDLTMAENAERIDRCVNKHTLEVVKEGGGYRLVWRDSQGTLNSLLPCLSTDTQPLSEEDLCARKVVIISDLPGMGKSTTLTSLSRHLVNSWLFRINLRDRPVDITNLPEKSVESVARFLAGAGSEPATLSLLRFCLQSQGSQQIHILLDGFDEIRDENAKEKILKLCHFLKNETTAKIIVTTRDNYKDVLVNRLSTVPTKFEEITKEIQLSFLVNFWHSNAVLGKKEERLRLFAQHLYEAAHKKLGRDIVGLIGIPLHTRMLAEAFLLQAEEFIDNAEPLSDIIGINNVYSLYNKFISVKRDIFLKEKISLDSNVIGDILCETLTAKLCVLAFKILDPEFKNKYLLMDKKYLNEMNRFGLTHCFRENRYDFIHRTFAEYFCSQLLVLWLGRENIFFMHLPIEEWFLSNLLINNNFEVVRKFLDEHLAEVKLAEKSKQLLYDNMSKCWPKDAAAFCDENGQTALHVAVKEGNTNIIDLLLGGLVKEQTRKPFESFLLARDYCGNTALRIGFHYFFSIIRMFYFGPNKPVEIGIKQMLNTRLSYELKYKLLLYTLFEDDWLSEYDDFPLNEKDQEDFQKALRRIKVLQREVLSKDPDRHKKQALPISIKNFILNEQNDIAERKFLPLAHINGQTAINIESSAGNYELVNRYIKINRDVVNSRGPERMTPLHCAAKGGHIKLVKFLHRKGAKLNACDSNGETALSYAVKNGNLDIVKYLLEKSADRNTTNEDGRTPLHYAIEGREWAIAKYLLESGADSNTTDEYGVTPLMCAVSYNLIYLKADLTEVNQRMEILQIIFSTSKDNNKSDSGRKTLLHYATEAGDTAVVEYIISEVKVDINCLDNEGMTPLHHAIKGGDMVIVKYLISEVKVDINCLDNEGMTPLHHAIKGGDMVIVKYLISEVKVDINCLDNEGKTPLHHAIKGGVMVIVKYLISEVKVDINCLDNEGMTPLHHAIKGGDMVIVKYLISEVKVDINCLDNEGKTPLHHAIKGGVMVIVKYLISEVKVDINCLDNEGMTPLHHAIKGGDMVIVKYLISEVKVDINCLDNEGMTPLHHAIKGGVMVIVKYLISEVKVDINCLDNEGKTPLHYAIELEKWTAAEYLIKAGADQDVSDHDGSTPLDYVTDAERLNRLKSINTPSGDPIT